MREKIKIRTLDKIDMISNLLSIILLIILLSSCDPGQELIFINETDSDLTIKIIEVGNSIGSIKYNKYNVRIDYDEPISDTTIIKLGTGKAKYDTIDFGLGTWEIHNRLDSFLMNLKEVSFTDKKDTISIKDKNRLDSLFRNNLSGKLNESIIIRIE